MANSTSIQDTAYLNTNWPEWLNYSSTRKKQLLVKNVNFGLQRLRPKWPILQFYRNLHILPLRHYLARLAKLQFYKNKKAPGQKFQFWSSATLAKMANSTILQEYAHAPHLDTIWPGWPNYSSTRKKQLLVKNFSFGRLAKMANSTILQ